MSQKRTTILVVDDNPAVTKVLTLLLGRQGYKVTIAADGEQGCALAREVKPALILCDERMPRMDGLSALTELKADKTTAHIPVLMIGGSGEGGERDWVKHGATGFIAKPFHIDEIVDQVQQILKAHYGTARQ